MENGGIYRPAELLLECRKFFTDVSDNSGHPSFDFEKKYGKLSETGLLRRIESPPKKISTSKCPSYCVTYDRLWVLGKKIKLEVRLPGEKLNNLVGSWRESSEPNSSYVRSGTGWEKFIDGRHPRNFDGFARWFLGPGFSTKFRFTEVDGRIEIKYSKTDRNRFTRRLSLSFHGDFFCFEKFRLGRNNEKLYYKKWGRA